jgi:di/tricarboxylate transporter
MIGYSAGDIGLRSRFGINLLAVSRQGRSSASRIRAMKIRAGDVLLMQGQQENIDGFVAFSDCIPLEERPLHLPDKRKAWTALAIMLAAVCCSATGLLSAPAAFAAGVLATFIARIIPLRIAYSIVDWPVIVLIAALIPVAGAIVSTGTANLAAGVLVDTFAQGNIVVGLTIILVVTMTLSDFLNNAATAAMMCPIAISTADRLGASSDAFLMAVAVGASCAFLTPIGHQNNTLILGPGGFRFGDYWRLGLPIEIIVVVVGVPLILLVWS